MIEWNCRTTPLEELRSDIDRIRQDDGRPLHSIHVMSDAMMAQVCQGNIRPQPIPGTGDDLMIVICKSALDAAMRSADMPMILSMDEAPKTLFGFKVWNSLPYDPAIWWEKKKREGCNLDALREILEKIKSSFN